MMESRPLPQLSLRAAFSAGAGVLLGLGFSGCDRKSSPGDGKEGRTEEQGPVEATTQGGPEAQARLPLAEQAMALPASGLEAKEGLETLNWTVDETGNPGRAVTAAWDAGPHRGRHRLALELTGGEKGFTSFRCEGAWSLKTGKKDATELTIYNGSAGALEIGLAYSCTEKFIWYESRPMTLKPGWNSLRLEQGASHFKTESSGWAYTAALWKPEDCRAVSLLVHNERRTGRLFIEYLGLAEARRAP